MSVKKLDSQNFNEEVVGSGKVSLVDFYADWCGPCKMIAPVMERIASAYEGQANIFKLNIDAAQDIAMRFGVTSIPTLIVFKGGKKVDQIVGALPQEQIESLLNQYL